MPALEELLHEAPEYRLQGISHYLGLTPSGPPSKADWVKSIQRHLCDPTYLESLVHRLPAEARRALYALLEAGGSLPASLFLSRFGPIRFPYSRRLKTSSRPWETPISPAEPLWYAGLLHLVLSPTTGNESAILPEELISPLSTLLSCAVAVPHHAQPED